MEFKELKLDAMMQDHIKNWNMQKALDIIEKRKKKTNPSREERKIISYCDLMLGINGITCYSSSNEDNLWNELKG